MALNVKLGFRASFFTQSIRLSNPTAKKRMKTIGDEMKANECSF